MPGESRRVKHLDPRGQFVVDTRELGRRPGSTLTFSRAVQAPADLSVGMAHVPEGTPLRLEVQLN